MGCERSAFQKLQQRVDHSTTSYLQKVARLGPLKDHNWNRAQDIPTSLKKKNLFKCFFKKGLEEYKNFNNLIKILNGHKSPFNVMVQ